MDSHADNETIIQRIVRLIKEKGVSEKAFCNYIGISQSAFVSWKNRGTNPNAKYLPDAAHFLGVSERYLISGEEKESGAGGEEEAFQAYLEEVRTRPEMRTLFSVAKGASEEDIEKAVKIIEMFKGE